MPMLAAVLLTSLKCNIIRLTDNLSLYDDRTLNFEKKPVVKTKQITIYEAKFEISLQLGIQNFLEIWRFGQLVTNNFLPRNSPCSVQQARMVTTFG